MTSIIYFGNNDTTHVLGQLINNDITKDINIVYDECNDIDKNIIDGFLSLITNCHNLIIENTPYVFNGDIVYPHTVSQAVADVIDYNALTIENKSKVDLFFDLL